MNNITPEEKDTILVLLKKYSHYVEMYKQQLYDTDILTELDQDKNQYYQLAHNRLFDIGNWYEHSIGDKFPQSYIGFYGYKPSLERLCKD